MSIKFQYKSFNSVFIGSMFLTISLQIFFILLLLLNSIDPVFARQNINPMVHQKGSCIVNGNDRIIKLRGVLLEGWLMWNGTLWGAGLRSETGIMKKLEKLVGEVEAKRFQKQVYQNFITEKDIELISKMGLNVVRVPFNHTILEEDNQHFKYKNSGWQLIDNLLSWCEKYQVYVVLDLHSAPGGQSNVFVNDPDGSGFYNSESNIKRTVSLWSAIAKRYKNRTIIAGYDLLNEPQIPLFQPKSKLVDVYKRITKGIRTFDKRHMIIYSGAGFASDDLSMLNKIIDSNQTIAFHTYNLFGSDIGLLRHKKFAALSKEISIPIWNGEVGAHKAEWISSVLAMLEDPSLNVSGWVFWPWKRVPENGNRYRHLMAIRSTKKWDKVRRWIADTLFARKPNKNDALEGMNEFLQTMKANELVLDYEMKAVITKHTTTIINK